MQEHHHTASTQAGVSDPVCGMAVDPAATAHEVTHGG